MPSRPLFEQEAIPFQFTDSRFNRTPEGLYVDRDPDNVIAEGLEACNLELRPSDVNPTLRLVNTADLAMAQTTVGLVSSRILKLVACGQGYMIPEEAIVKVIHDSAEDIPAARRLESNTINHSTIGDINKKLALIGSSVTIAPVKGLGLRMNNANQQNGPQRSMPAINDYDHLVAQGANRGLPPDVYADGDRIIQIVRRYTRDNNDRFLTAQGPKQAVGFLAYTLRNSQSGPIDAESFSQQIWGTADTSIVYQGVGKLCSRATTILGQLQLEQQRVGLRSIDGSIQIVVFGGQDKRSNGRDVS